MIVKVQIPLETNMEEAQAFIYDESREFEAFMPVFEELLVRMKGEPKKYFYAHIENDDEIVLEDEAPDQEW